MISAITMFLIIGSPAIIAISMFFIMLISIVDKKGIPTGEPTIISKPRIPVTIEITARTQKCCDPVIENTPFTGVKGNWAVIIKTGIPHQPLKAIGPLMSKKEAEGYKEFLLPFECSIVYIGPVNQYGVPENYPFLTESEIDGE